MSFSWIKFWKSFCNILRQTIYSCKSLRRSRISPKLNLELNYPYLLLLISGGHSQYLSVKNLNKYKRLGTTIDDAIGEAFDKTAKLLGVEFQVDHK